MLAALPGSLRPAKRASKRSAYINGFGELSGDDNAITCYNYGLSDRSENVEIWYPSGHLGGGAVSRYPINNGTLVKAELKKLDDVFGPEFICDLVKIDVEGHELNVLRGMRNIITRSRNIKVLFEKLARNCGNESEIEHLLNDCGLELYGVCSQASLKRLSVGGLSGWSGYVLATRASEIAPDDFARTRFFVYPRQLFTSNDTLTALSRDSLIATGRAGLILCHGPYWFLRKGIYRFRLRGAIEGQVSVTIAARFGHCVLQFEMATGDFEKTFIVERDVVHFECIIRPKDTRLSTIRVESIEFRRVG